AICNCRPRGSSRPTRPPSGGRSGPPRGAGRRGAHERGHAALARARDRVADAGADRGARPSRDGAGCRERKPPAATAVGPWPRPRRARPGCARRAPRGADHRTLAPRPHRIRPGRLDPDRARWAHARGTRRPAGTGAPSMSEPRGPRPSIEIGVRRVTELDPGAPLPESDPRLVERIAREIRRNGPMPFARFMELALYDPEAGYYTANRGEDAGAAGPGRSGDFLTAPEGHAIFGWAIAQHLESVWDALGRPARFVVREYGAGTGAIAAGVLDGLRRAGSGLAQAIRYQAVDASEARLAALRRRLQASGL